MRKVYVILFFLSAGLLGCQSMLYYPSREKFYDPVRVFGPSYKPEDIYFSSADGTKLHAWYFKNISKMKTKALIVHFHGNAENITTHFGNLVWLIQYGFDYFIFDYRGYGESEGEIDTKGSVQDGMAALSWAQHHKPHLPLIVHSQSLGGAIALRAILNLKREIPIRLIVAESTFRSYQKAGASVMSSSWLTWIFQPLTYLLLSDRYAPGKDIKNLSPIPVLVIHGDHDRVVNYSLGLDLFEKLSEPKEFWKIPGGEHLGTWYLDQNLFQGRLVKKFNEILK